MHTATVSEKGQVVIPAMIRRSLGIKAGTALVFEMEGSAIRINLQQRVYPSDIDTGFGMLTAAKSRKPRKLSAFDVASAMQGGQ